MVPRECLEASYRQFSISPSQSCPLNDHSDVGSHDGKVGSEAGDRPEEVAKQDHDSVELDAEAYQRPPQEDQGKSGEERQGPLDLLFPGEEEERLLRPDDDRQSDEEEDLESSRRQ